MLLAIQLSSPVHPAAGSSTANALTNNYIAAQSNRKGNCPKSFQFMFHLNTSLGKLLNDHKKQRSLTVRIGAWGTVVHLNSSPPAGTMLPMI